MNNWYTYDPLQVQMTMRERWTAAERAHLVRLARAAQPREPGYLRRRVGTLLIAAGEALVPACQETPCPECA